jgi:hypothetical protein
MGFFNYYRDKFTKLNMFMCCYTIAFVIYVITPIVHLTDYTYNPEIFKNEYVCEINELTNYCPDIYCNISIKALNITQNIIVEVGQTRESCYTVFKRYYEELQFKCYYYNNTIYSEDHGYIVNQYYYQDTTIIAAIVMFSIFVIYALFMICLYSYYKCCYKEPEHKDDLNDLQSTMENNDHEITLQINKTTSQIHQANGELDELRAEVNILKQKIIDLEHNETSKEPSVSNKKSSVPLYEFDNPILNSRH